MGSGRAAVIAATLALALPGLAAGGGGPGAFVVKISAKAPGGFEQAAAAQLEFRAGQFATVVPACAAGSQAACSSISFPQEKITLRVADAALDELRGRLQKQADAGEPEPECSFVLRDAQGQPVRTFNLYSCFPVAFSTVGADPSSSDLRTETVVIKVDRFEEA